MSAEGGGGLPRCLSCQVTVFIQFWVSENLFPVRRFICVIKLLATCNNVNNASNMDNNNVGNSGNYHNFWLVKVCNNFSRFPPLPPPETKKWRKMHFNISHKVGKLQAEGGAWQGRRCRRRLRLFRDLCQGVCVCVIMRYEKFSLQQLLLMQSRICLVCCCCCCKCCCCKCCCCCSVALV